VTELSAALALGDYQAMAVALCNMGATEEDVDTVKFGKDIQKVMEKLSMVQPDLTISAMADGTVMGSLQLDEAEVTNVLLEIVAVTEENGLKLPREFGLLVKQSLYFDRYLKILAPNVNVMDDTRVGGLAANREMQLSLQPNGDVVIDV
jgi:aarF domain-containing kinase